MDPLSFSASLIAVIGATASTIKLLKKAQNLRHLPDQLCALLNEISDLRCVLRILEGLGEEEASEEVRGSLTRLLKRAKVALDELEKLLKTALVNSEYQQEHTKLRVSRWIWVRRQSQMKRLRAEIKDVRSCAQMTLLGINSSFAQLMNFKIDRLVILQTDLNQKQQQFQESIETSQDNPLNQLTVLCGSPSILPIQGNSSEVFTSSSHSPQTDNHTVVCVETSRRWTCQCPIACSCQCHSSSTFSFPTSLKTILGALFVGYSGSIIFDASTCNQKACRRRKTSSFRMTYYFPAWFLSNVISVCYTRFFYGGPRFSLQISRVRPKSSDVFLAATIGDIGWLQSLFQQGLASPFDVAAEDGQSVLQKAIDGNMSTVVFLLRQGADPYHRHHFNTSAADGFWRERHRLRAVGVESVDEPFEIKRILDDPEFVDSLQLSTVHKIVFRLADISLDQFLSISSNEIDSQDSTGKSPLHWAILHNDLGATKTLLDRGADVNIYDFMRRSPLCYAVWLAKDTAICQLVLAACPDIESRDVYGQTPLMYACQNKDHIGIDGCRILLAVTGIDPNARRLDGYTALHIAVQENNAEQIRLLIEHGTSIDLETKDGWTPLMVAIKANNHRALSALLGLGVKMTKLDPRSGAIVSDALTIAAARGDRQTLEILHAANFSTMDKEEGRNAVEVAKEIFLTRQEEEQAELRTAFSILVTNVGVRSLDCGLKPSGDWQDTEAIDANQPRWSIYQAPQWSCFVLILLILFVISEIYLLKLSV